MIHLPNLPMSALAEKASPKMSERYVHINTQDVVKLMAEEGWHVASAKSAAPRRREALFAKHMIDFRRADAQEINGTVPRVIFINSHDGTSAASALAGYFRFVCSNGLVIGNTIAQRRARHVYRDAREFVSEMNSLTSVIEDSRKLMERWAKRQLTKPQREELARLAGQLRWGDALAYEPAELLSCRRAEDDDGSLYTTFNRLQENTTRGGITGVARSGRNITSQPISCITRDTTFNANLWQLTTEFEESLP